MKYIIKALKIFLVLIIVYIGVTAFFVVKYSHDGIFGIVEEFSNENRPFTFLLMGVDQSSAIEGERQRSDVMMIVRVDPKSGGISVVGLPRDTMVSIGDRNYVERINHAYRYGGARLSLDTLNSLLGTDIKDYMVVDYNFVRRMVKLVGGVKVDVPMDMKYDDPYADPPLHIDLKAGVQVLDENTAIQFLRFRKGYANHDLGRIQAQQQFVSSFLDALKSPVSVIKFPFMLKYFGENIESNIGIERLIHLSFGYNKYGSDNINFVTLPGSPVTVNGMSLYELNMERVEEILKEHLIK